MVNMLSQQPARHAAAIGLIGLAAAMGIGRFAFTPMLPLMQASGSLTLSQGGYLAGANYAGYLLGAVLCLFVHSRPAATARLGLVAVAASTLAMALTSSFVAWLGLRLIAGVASALVLVGISSWSMAVLAHHQRLAWSGWVFAGVGTGIFFAGLATLAIGAAHLSPSSGWLFFGVAAALVAGLAGMSLRDTADSQLPRRLEPTDAATAPLPWRPIVCYGIIGFGYIIPATFLPSTARALISDPAVFGWTWPVFGLAAALSTVAAGSFLHGVAPRRSWAFGQLLMAAGVAVPALWLSLPSLILSATCVGGTFMVVIMAGLQEARRIGGHATPRLIAAMTAAFAGGQLAGPLVVAVAGTGIEVIRGPSLLAAMLLVLASLALLQDLRPGARSIP